MNPQKLTTNDTLILIFAILSGIGLLLILAFALINYLGNVEFKKQAKRFVDNVKCWPDLEEYKKLEDQNS